MSSFLLLETGDYLLLESGSSDKLILELAPGQVITRFSNVHFHKTTSSVHFHSTQTHTKFHKTTSNTRIS